MLQIWTEEVDIETHDIKFQQDTWAICLTGYETDKNYRKLINWEHIFHEEWIEEYFKNK